MALSVQLECYEVEVLGGELRTKMALSVQLEYYEAEVLAGEMRTEVAVSVSSVQLYMSG